MPIHPTAEIEAGATVGASTDVWAQVHIRSGATIGEGGIIGEKTYVAGGVIVGDRVKINAMAYLCAGLTVEDGVMIAAAVVFTNDRYPRAATNDLTSLLSSEAGEQTLPTLVRRGATIGARVVVGSGLVIGEFAMVGMGSVVTRDVPAHALVVGNPARQTAWVCQCGQPVHRVAIGAPRPTGELVCERCGWRFRLGDDGLVSIGPP